jgi:class 3 adenylate cyclase
VRGWRATPRRVGCDPFQHVRTPLPRPPRDSLAVPVSASPDGAERRPITVMFCDLVGSTSLAAKLDAEDWRNLVNAYLDQASAAAMRALVARAGVNR